MLAEPPVRVRTRLAVPVRVDLLGGWSDQALWDYPAAVLSVAIGWEDASGAGVCPTWVDERGFHSGVNGYGTGLGISSIKSAAEHLYRHPEACWRECVEVSVEAEAGGGQGGWQDAASALTPGVKLFTQDNVYLTDLGCLPLPEHPLARHLVLFDTGLRRNSRAIGDQVRRLFSGGAGEQGTAFRHALRQNVRAAEFAARCGDWETIADACMDGWIRLVHQVPDMTVYGIPSCSDLAYGWKLAGAGGGGFGVYFVREPEMREPLVKRLREEEGIWAVVPEVLDGAQVVHANADDRD